MLLTHLIAVTRRDINDVRERSGYDQPHFGYGDFTSLLAAVVHFRIIQLDVLMLGYSSGGFAAFSGASAELFHVPGTRGSWFVCS